MDLFHPVAPVVDCFTWKKDTKHNVTKLSRNTFLTYDVDIYGFHKEYMSLKQLFVADQDLHYSSKKFIKI